MKIAAILGTCSEAIKLAPILRELRADDDFDCQVCVTDQRQQELDGLLEEFEVQPDASLDLTAPGLSLSGLTSVAIARLDAYLRRETPHMVMLEGASTVSFAAALSSFYRNIPILHLESDPRPEDLDSPWPQDANQLLIRRLAELHISAILGEGRVPFAERISPESVIVTGCTGIDALHYAVSRVRQQARTFPDIPAELQQRESQAPLVLIAGRGHECFDNKLEMLCRDIAGLAGAFPHAHFVFSMPLSELAKLSVQQAFAALSNVHLLQRLPYFAFVALLDRATLLLTDSGTVRKEAGALGKPVLPLYGEGGRQPLLECSATGLAADSQDRIVPELTRLLSDPSYLASRSTVTLYSGDGQATQRIVRAIKSRYGRSPGQPRIVEGLNAFQC